MPVAVTLKVAVAPMGSVWLNGWVTMATVGAGPLRELAPQLESRRAMETEAAVTQMQRARVATVQNIRPNYTGVSELPPDRFSGGGDVSIT